MSWAMWVSSPRTASLRCWGWVRAVLARVDADALRVKAAKERLDRFLHAYPSNVTTCVASLPAPDSAACWAAIDDLAHRMRGDDFGQPAADPNPLIEPTWAQIAAMGYEIPGIGVIGGDVVAGILDKFDTRIARVLLDEHTGIVIETRIKDYLPNKAMRRFVQARDGHCRFPGCARTANRCEPDHIIAFSRGGPTAIWNLASVQTPPPGQTQRRLGADHDPRRRLYLDRPPTAAVRHPPDQPPRNGRLTLTPDL